MVNDIMPKRGWTAEVEKQRLDVIQQADPNPDPKPGPNPVDCPVQAVAPTASPFEPNSEYNI